MNVGLAGAGVLPAVMNVLDGADLEVQATAVATAIDRERVLVAQSRAGTVLGAAVVNSEDSGAEIAAIAVRPGRRGQGIGTALIEAAGERWGRLEAAFDPSLVPFYRQAGFEIECADRCRGVRPARPALPQDPDTFAPRPRRSTDDRGPAPGKRGDDRPRGDG
jgi:GNAT superfamily N-acetyltransferase